MHAEVERQGRKKEKRSPEWMGLFLKVEICSQCLRSFKNLQIHHNYLSKRRIACMPKGFARIERYQGSKLKKLKVWKDARGLQIP